MKTRTRAFIERLYNMQANLTGTNPKDLLTAFIAIMGPDWDDDNASVLYAILNTLSIQNQKIMELRREVAELKTFKERTEVHE